MADIRSPARSSSMVRMCDSRAGTVLEPFDNWIRMPGLNSVTLPDETGAANEVLTMDGPISAPGQPGVGQITMPIGGLSNHMLHQWLAARKA